MSTNYYVRTDPCKHCGRGDGDVHIGKSSSGFQGYTEDRPSPWGPILSWADWQRVLREHGLTVVSEYEERIPVDEFIAMRNAVASADRRRQFDWMESHYANHGDWLDADGWSFTASEFS